MNGSIKAGRHTFVPEDLSCFIDLEIGAFTSIASGLKIASGQHPTIEHRTAVSNFPFSEHGWGAYPPSRMGGRVTIGNDVWIGESVMILDGVHIEDGSIVGAGSVVSRSTRPYSIVAGNPAREHRRRFTDTQIVSLLELKWWEWSDEQIRDSLADLSDISRLLRAHGKGW